MTAPIVLASKSAIRRTLLESAGVEVVVEVSGVDEEAVKRSMAGETGEAVARALAESKARSVSLKRLEDWVIGADQVLRLESQLFDKVRTLEAARRRLLSLRGVAHELVTAVVLARGGEVRGAHVSVVRMQMRDFSDAWLDDYLARAGDAILSSVGCYHYEGIGVQLFERVDGDCFSILGLPLLPLLALLRDEGLIGA